MGMHGEWHLVQIHTTPTKNAAHTCPFHPWRPCVRTDRIDPQPTTFRDANKHTNAPLATKIM